jgi:diguanylate cyclase (GGDEF)-like protein/PAS domain S-box-containing protein
MKERLNILLVDDDRDEYLLLKGLIAQGRRELGHVRFEIDWVETYEDALEACQAKSYDALLVDYFLGSRSGLELVKEIAGRGIKAPVILLTGQGSYQIDLAAMEAGAADYLVKGELSLPVLERTIRYAIEQKQAQDRLETLVQERTAELTAANRELKAEIERRLSVENELRLSETRFRTLADTTSAAILIVEGVRIRYANPAVRYITGYSPEELNGQEIWKIIHPTYRRILERYGLGGTWQDFPAMRYELKIVTRAGEERWVDVTAGEMDLEGKPAWLMTAFDITERDLAERELRKAKEELEQRVAERTAELQKANRQLSALAQEAQESADEMAAIFDAMAEAVTVFDAGGALLRANRVAIEALGFDPWGQSREQIRQKAALRRIDGSPIEEGESPIGRALQGETVRSMRLLINRPDGQEVYISISSAPLYTAGRLSGAVAVWQDVTEHEHLLEQLEAERTRLKMVVENAPAGIVMAGRSGKLALANPAAEAISGRRLAGGGSEEGARALNLHRPDGRPYEPGETILERAALKGEAHNEVEMLVVTPQGERRFILANAAPLRDRKGRLSGAIAMFQDITRRKQADEEIRRRVRELDALQAAAQAMLSTLDLDELLYEILQAAHKAIPAAEKGLLHLLENGGPRLRLWAASGFELAPRDQTGERSGEVPGEMPGEMPGGQPGGQPALLEGGGAVPASGEVPGGGYPAVVVGSRRPLLLSGRAGDQPDAPPANQAEDPRAGSPDQASLLQEGLPPEAGPARSLVAAPLMVREDCFGSLALVSPETGAFSEVDLRLLEAFAAAASAAIQNARLYSKVQQLSMTDALTGLYNRRGLNVVGGQEIERTRRFNSPLAAVMLDLDHFKEINDAYGHTVGDEVLRALAERLLQMVRRLDVLCRYGGEEFALLLPENDLASAYEVAERIRAWFEANPIETSAGLLAVTISAGVADTSDCLLELETLLECADQALYRAKDLGRNRVEAG